MCSAVVNTVGGCDSQGARWKGEALFGKTCSLAFKLTRVVLSSELHYSTVSGQSGQQQRDRRASFQFTHNTKPQGIDTSGCTDGFRH